jgi:hypothetical protein
MRENIQSFWTALTRNNICNYRNDAGIHFSNAMKFQEVIISNSSTHSDYEPSLIGALLSAATAYGIACAFFEAPMNFLQNVILPFIGYFLLAVVIGGVLFLLGKWTIYLVTTNRIVREEDWQELHEELKKSQASAARESDRASSIAWKYSELSRKFEALQSELTQIKKGPESILNSAISDALGVQIENDH